MSLVEARLLLGTGSDNSITTRFSLVRLLTEKENKELFPTENIKQKERLFLRTKLLLLLQLAKLQPLIAIACNLPMGKSRPVKERQE